MYVATYVDQYMCTRQHINMYASTCESTCRASANVKRWVGDRRMFAGADGDRRVSTTPRGPRYDCAPAHTSARLKSAGTFCNTLTHSAAHMRRDLSSY